MMPDDYRAKEITDLNEAVNIQTAGLRQLLKILAGQTQMLKDILAACTAPGPDEPSPLVKLILKMNANIDDQSAAIHRIETAVVR